MKKPEFIISTDWHITERNKEAIKDLVRQKCELAIKEGVSTLICLGDVFDSRKAQPLSVLTAFGEILDMINEYGLTLLVISGNHDKSDYEAYESYLDSFKHHPTLELFWSYGYRQTSTLELHFFPFFSENKWVENYNEDGGDYIKKPDKINILLSHIAVNGSTNNDGSKVESSIKPSMFKGYYKVFLGHYHEMQQISSNIYHLPSIQANNYGENNEKGFTILYSDGSHELVKSKFKEYEVVEIDLDIVSKEDLEEVTKTFANNDDLNVRFKFVGDKSKLEGVNIDKYTAMGIDVKKVEKDIQNTEIDFKELNITYTDSDILNEFASFCEETHKDYKKGIKYLT